MGMETLALSLVCVCGGGGGAGEGGQGCRVFDVYLVMVIIYYYHCEALLASSLGKKCPLFLLS